MERLLIPDGKTWPTVKPRTVLSATFLFRRSLEILHRQSHSTPMATLAPGAPFWQLIYD